MFVCDIQCTTINKVFNQYTVHSTIRAEQGRLSLSVYIVGTSAVALTSWQHYCVCTMQFNYVHLSKCQHLVYSVKCKFYCASWGEKLKLHFCAFNCVLFCRTKNTMSTKLHYSLKIVMAKSFPYNIKWGLCSFWEICLTSHENHFRFSETIFFIIACKIVWPELP